MSDSETYLIWSHDHSAWWRAERCGYTPRLAEAGRYSHTEALVICISAMPGADEALNELPVRLQDALDMAAAYRVAYGERPERWQ